MTNYFPAQTHSVVSLNAPFPIRLRTSICHLHAVWHFDHSYKNDEVADPTAFVVRKLLQGASKLRPSVDSRAPITTYILYLLVRSAHNFTHCYYHNMLIPAMYRFAFHAILRIGEIAVSSANQRKHCSAGPPGDDLSD